MSRSGSKLIPSFGTAALGVGATEPTSLAMAGNGPAIAPTAPRHSLAGYGRICLAIRFVRWADSQRNPPTYEEIMDRFQCCRATAFRWLAAYTAEHPRRAA